MQQDIGSITYAVPCSTTHCQTVPYSTVQYIALHYMQYITWHVITLHRNTSLYIAFQLHCHHTCTQYDMIPRNVVGDGSRIKPGMHKWPGEPPTNATSQNDVFTCFFCICLEKQLQLSCNRIAYKSYTYTLSCRLKERTRGCQISPKL